jgi:hypothetical protein
VRKQDRDTPRIPSQSEMRQFGSPLNGSPGTIRIGGLLSVWRAQIPAGQRKQNWWLRNLPLAGTARQKRTSSTLG